MKIIFKEIKSFLSNYLAIFWILSVCFILSFITTMISIALVYSEVNKNKLIQQSILSVIITFAGIIFLRNWIKAYKKNEEIYKEKDYGLAWLAAAMFCWSLFICLDFLRVLSDIGPAKYLGPIFSSLNSICFLFSIEYFDSMKERQKAPKLLLMLGVNAGTYKRNVSAYVLGVLLAIITIVIAGNPHLSLWNGSVRFSWSGIVDAVLLGLLTITILLITLIKTWSSEIRKDRWMVALTIIVLLFTLIMQFVNAWDNGEYYPTAYAIAEVLYRVLLIMLFYGIAFSWTYSMLVKQNEELDEAQTELEFAHKNMRHGILNNVLILKMDLDDTLTALKNTPDFPGKKDSLRVVTEIFNRYDFLLQISRLLYNPEEVYTDDVFFAKLMNVVKQVLNLNDNEFVCRIDIKESLTKSANQQRDFGIIAYELITNAKKYGSKEVVNIEVEITGKKPEMIFKVKDQGPNFFNIEKARSAGTLRGLNSVLSRIDFYKGTYHTSENFPGTVFVVTLPV